MYCPDNYDLFVMHENEQERRMEMYKEMYLNGEIDEEEYMEVCECFGI